MGNTGTKIAIKITIVTTRPVDKLAQNPLIYACSGFSIKSVKELLYEKN